MKRLQIYIETELDEELGAQAVREGTSKAALVRRFVAERLRQRAIQDPLDALVGDLEGISAPIDDVVYGP